MATPTNLPAAFVSGDILTAANINLIRGGFRILQVVNASTSGAVQNNSSTFADTGLTATITPQSTSNKVLVIISHNGCFKNLNDSENRMNLRLLRGSTTISTFVNGLFLYTNTAQSNGGSASVNFTDSPASVSAQTYKTQFMNPNNTNGVIVQESGSLSTITLMEISA